MPTEPTNLRLDVDAKAGAYAVFDTLGMKPAQAVNLFFRQVALHGGIPFELKVPNADTAEAMRELESGGGTRYKNTQEMFKDLGV